MRIKKCTNLSIAADPFLLSSDGTDTVFSKFSLKIKKSIIAVVAGAERVNQL